MSSLNKVMKSLVEYSSSSDDEALNESNSVKTVADHGELTKKRKLPAPDWLKNKAIKGDDEENIDNPDEHQGRQRSIKHERGIWATFLYIPIPINDPIEEMQQKIKEFCCEKVNLSLEIIENLHISVTKLLILKHHWIQSFIDSVADKIDSLSLFKVSFGTIDIYCNEERTRTFLGVKPVEVESLLKVTSGLDECLEEFKLPKYYESPSFHASILWCLGDKSESLKGICDELQELCESVMSEHPVQIQVTELLCKCGNRSYKFPFR